MAISFLLLNTGDDLLLNSGNRLLLNLSVITGVSLVGSHAKPYFGDARFDKKPERESFTYTWPATAKIQVMHHLDMSARLQRTESILVSSRISMIKMITAGARIFKSSPMIGIRARITRTPSPTGAKAEEQAKRRRLIRSLISELLQD